MTVKVGPLEATGVSEMEQTADGRAVVRLALEHPPTPEWRTAFLIEQAIAISRAPKSDLEYALDENPPALVLTAPAPDFPKARVIAGGFLRAVNHRIQGAALARGLTHPAKD